MKVTAYGRQTVPDRGVVRSRDPLQNCWGCNHITGTAEPKVVKFCTRVGYINSNNRMTYHQEKGRGYGHVTVLKFCRLPCCSASRGLVSDSSSFLSVNTNMAALFVNIRSEVGLPLKSQQKNDVRLLLTDPLQLTQLHN